MLKINLSDQDASAAAEPTDSRTTDPTPSLDALKEIAPKRHFSPWLVGALLVVAIAWAGYTYKDRLMALLPASKPTTTEAPAPVPAPSVEPADSTMAVVGEPDPTFVVLNRIGEVLPERVWLASMVVSMDGGYELEGISFSHDAVITFDKALGSIGTVSKRAIPEKTASAETVYRFSLAGKVNDFASPDSVDLIALEDLATLAAAIVPRAKELGVEFSVFPKTGQAVTDADLPFVLTGSFDGLRQVIAELCPPAGAARIFRMIITPVAPGRSFDAVKASFALRATPKN